jgi:hypothetical protein
MTANNIASELLVCVVSHAREKVIPEFYDRENWVYIVGNGEGENYRQAGFRQVIEGGSLIDSRNTALDLADKENKRCLQLSDDLGKIFLGENQVTLNELIKYAYDFSVRFDIPLLGINPVFNKFYQRETVTNGFVIGDFTLTKPNTGIRYDRNVRLKEDYDFTLQYLAKYKSAKRLNNVICEFKHYANKGGAVEYRTDDLEKQTVEYLEKKWGKAVRRNIKRKQAYEILIARDWYKFVR